MTEYMDFRAASKTNRQLCDLAKLITLRRLLQRSTETIRSQRGPRHEQISELTRCRVPPVFDIVQFVRPELRTGWTESSNACRNFLYASPTGVYIIFAVQIKLYLDDTKGYGHTKLHRIWDNLGDIPRFENLGINGFTLRAPRIKARKRKREESPLSEDIFEDMEYGDSDGLGDYEDPNDISEIDWHDSTYHLPDSKTWAL
ncbi:hypothetical protein BZA05DRAFT_421269 [Tricharina praecox]|uniref:uncharacterized protein n=1 Tax=Tricharina praecox TaxID=43433 RepID=UPI0022209AAC|nr:uncharacterized protein BZA05DRAFT_421269 [Tricharina praecox]KAI5845450.1 hypothetical protein BZA05DRAFT_421269 [Tricharina praecox]